MIINKSTMQSLEEIVSLAVAETAAETAMQKDNAIARYHRSKRAVERMLDVLGIAYPKDKEQ